MNFTKHCWFYCLTGSLSLIANEDRNAIAQAKPAQTVITVQPGSKIMIRGTKGQSISTNENALSQPAKEKTSTPPLAQDNTRFNLFAEFLYWKRTDGIQFISDGIGFFVLSGIPSQNESVSERGATYFPEFSFAPGFNAGLGVQLPYDGWDLELSYSWVRNEGTRHFSRDPAKKWQNYPLFLTEVDLAQEIDHAQQKAVQELNYFQLELGREFCTSKQLLLRPVVEIVALYNPASLHLSYDYGVAVGTEVFKHTIFRTHAQGLGFGAGVGLDTQWKLSDHWSISGNLKIDGVWDHFKSKVKEEITRVTAPGYTIQNLLGKISFNKLLYLTNIFLGIDWHTTFYKDKCCIAAYAGWNFFSGLTNYFALSQANIYAEKYAYQGLRTGLTFEF